VLDILNYYVPVHSAPESPDQVPVSPYIPILHPLFQSRELTKQFPSVVAFDNSHYLLFRPKCGERYQKMDLIFPDFYSQCSDLVHFADLANHLFRWFPDFLPFDVLLPIYQTPDQMEGCVVDRMTRLLETYDPFISQRRKGPMSIGQTSRFPLSRPRKPTRQPSKVS
jgi:hypothetical protein